MIEGFFNNVENADKLGGLVEDIRDAMIWYQVCINKPYISCASDIRTRPHCNKTTTIRAVNSS